MTLNNKLKLSKESSKKNNNIIKKKLNINPISLNLENISSIHNNNNISVNSFDLSFTKNHSLNSENYYNSKRRRRNLILRGNQFRTFDNPSISDSNSSTHNS